MTVPEKAMPEALETVASWPARRSELQRELESQSNLVPIRLPTGEQAWVTPQAFNLIGEKTFRDSEQLRRLHSQRNLAVAIAAGALIILAAGLVSLATRPAARPVELTRPSSSVEATTTQPKASTAIPSGTDGDIVASLQAWAEAWSARDADTVLGFYSQSFPVPDGLRRPLWEQLRRERVESPELLAVTLSDLAIEVTGSDSATAHFLQRYDTPGYRLWVKKTLQLADESGVWRIVAESASLAELGSSARAEPENVPSAPVISP